MGTLNLFFPLNNLPLLRLFTQSLKKISPTHLRKLKVIDEFINCVPKIHTELMKSSLLCTFNKLSMQSIDLIESEPVPEKAYLQIWQYIFFLSPSCFPHQDLLDLYQSMRLLYPKCQQRFVGRPNLDSSFFLHEPSIFCGKICHYYTHHLVHLLLTIIKYLNPIK